MIPYKKFDVLHIPYKTKLQSSNISSIRAGGEISIAVYPRNISELIYILKVLKQEKIKYMLIGNCTNTLFRDEGYDGVVIFTKGISGFESESGAVNVMCGTTLAYLIRKLSLCGIEVSSALSGIPGTLGAMVRGNCGCYGVSLEDIFLSCSVYDPSCDKIFTLSKADMRFGYRTSIISSENLIVLTSKLKTELVPHSKIEEKLLEFSRKRREAQPSEPSLGSFFKRPEGTYASLLIDRCSLRGLTVGDAQVSLKHAGFIINRGNATAKDIIELSNIVKEKVFDRFSVMLEKEVEII